MTTTPTLPPELDPRGPTSRPAGDRPVVVRSSGSRAGRLARGVAIGTAAVTLATSGILWTIYARVDGNIERLAGITSGGSDDQVTFLIVGADSREGEGNDAFQAGGGEERVAGSRSDTTIMATFNKGDSGATLVSFPRDAWVTIPAHTASDGSPVAATQARINTAFQQGGPGLLVNTLQNLTGQEIDHYIEVDFAGFQRIVDALGGVNVCLTEAAKEPLSGIDLPAGESRLDGSQALAFVRQRHDLPRGDLDRIARQQAFLASVVREASATGTLLNVVKLTALLDAVSESVRVDDGLTVGGLKDFALRFRELTAGQVGFATAPVAEQKRIDGKAVLLLDNAKLRAMFEQQSQAPEPAETGLTVAPGDISVQVLNGAGVQGLARRAADDLAKQGFAIDGSPRNAETSTATQTVILHPDDRAAAARTLQAAIPGAVLEVDAAATGITVIVGSTYDGTSAAAAPPATPTPGTSPGTPPGTPPVVETTSAAAITCTA